MKIVDNALKIVKIALLAIIAYLGYQMYQGGQALKKKVVETVQGMVDGLKSASEAAKEWANKPTGKEYDGDKKVKSTSFEDKEVSGRASSSKLPPTINVVNQIPAPQKTEAATLVAGVIIVAVLVWFFWPKKPQNRHKFAANHPKVSDPNFCKLLKDFELEEEKEEDDEDTAVAA